jgi:long-chain acyl-CoA synthetase
MDQRPWHASYPAGVPATIDPDRYASLAELCLASCARNGDKVAFSNQGVELSFADLEHGSRSLAAYLSTELGLSRGDRVAVMLPNLLQSPLVLLGVLRAGLVAVNVNPLYTAPELEHQLADSGARAIVVLENFAATLEKVLPATAIETVIVTAVGDSLPLARRVVTNVAVRFVKRLVPSWHIEGSRGLRDVLERGGGLAYQDPALSPSDLAFLQYTGGTTGVAKGAMLSHRNVVSNVLQASAWVRPFFDGEHDTAVTPLPLYHIFALTVNLFTFIELGAHNVLITNPRDLKGFVRTLKAHHFAFITGVNTLFNSLAHTRGFDDVDFSHLKVSLAGGMAVQADVARSWKAATGVVITQGYGLTEASPVVTANRLDVTEFTGSVGLPFPSTDVAILGEDGSAVAQGQVGEIAVKGPQVMVGYWNRPEETAGVFTSDGWLKTGDIGRMDETGHLFIEDRKKDIIIVSGFNVYPNEVEDVVTSHPGVLEAAAIGVPDKRSGEAVKVFIVRKDPQLAERDVRQFCRERLTGYKTPDIIEFVDELPKSNVGKVLRRELKEAEAAKAKAAAQGTSDDHSA